MTGSAPRWRSPACCWRCSRSPWWERGRFAAGGAATGVVLDAHAKLREQAEQG
ncbi:MAG: hypothetical protein ACOX8C_03500 [Saccharomonospora viridis]|uniref:hypothetical protein n=1 Tax=Saccharomonospora viridis TaxID=1852 RepID=UPI003D9068E0